MYLREQRQRDLSRVTPIRAGRVAGWAWQRHLSASVLERDPFRVTDFLVGFGVDCA